VAPLPHRKSSFLLSLFSRASLPIAIFADSALGVRILERVFNSARVWEEERLDSSWWRVVAGGGCDGRGEGGSRGLRGRGEGKVSAS
jgi:hypothetical protein